MNQSIRLEAFLRSICQDVSVADIEMQLLQHHAWQTLVSEKIELTMNGDESVDELRRALLDELGTDRHLALNEVCVSLTLARRSAWSKFWFRIRHPRTGTNPDFKLAALNDSISGINFQLTFKRQSSGKWNIQPVEETSVLPHLEFLA